jgi:predicted nucleic acid-binding protein
MRILLDSNVVLRLGDRGHAMHAEALAAIDWLDANGHECVIVPQVLYEYWVVATRPAENNGLGMSVANAAASIRSGLRSFASCLTNGASSRTGAISSPRTM